VSKRIKYLFQKIRVGRQYQAPNWDEPVTVASIEGAIFIIEDSNIEGVEVVFKDTAGRMHRIAPVWSDETQGYSLEV
jgi:hypothetical protein